MTLLAQDRQQAWKPVWLIDLTGAASRSWIQLDWVQNDMIQRGVPTATARRFATRDIDVAGVFYHGRIIDEPVVEQGFFDSFFGVTRVTTVGFRLANVDGALNDYHTLDIRGTTLTITRYDAADATSVVEFTGKIASTALGEGYLEVEAVAPDLSVFEQPFPAGTVTAEVFTSRAVDMGATIPVIFGNVVAHRCPYVNDNVTDDEYDYLVGRGVLTVSALYRDGPNNTLYVVNASEYTVETSRYSGMTTVRFPNRQVNFANGFHAIFADVTGLSAERNFARAIRTLLSDTTYGLSQSVNAASFTAAEALIDPVTGTSVTGLYCVSGNTRVTLADGSQKTIRDIVTSRERVEVLSFDAATGRIIPNKVVDWFTFPARKSEWRRVRLVAGQLPGAQATAVTVTPDHPFWTDRGWVAARDLIPSDRIYRYRRGLTPTAQEAVVGMLLGDGHMTPLGRFQVRHGEPQSEYAQFLAAKFEVRPTWLTQPGYRGPGRPHGPSRKAVDVKIRLKSVCPDLIGLTFRQRLDRLTPVGLAFLYMDDGNLQQDRRSLRWRPCAQIHTEGLTAGQREQLADVLLRRWNLAIRFYKRNNTKGCLGRLTPTSSEQFFGLIAPYVHPSMRYKLPTAYHHVPFVLADLPFRMMTAVPFACRVRSVTGYESVQPHSKRDDLTTAYDIKVEGARSFIANEFITHNCDGVFAPARAASDVLRDLLMVRGMRMGMNASGEWTLTVDTEQADIRMLLNDGTGAGERNILAVVSPRRRPPIQDSIRTYRLRYRQSAGLGDEARLEVTRPVHAGLGHDVVVEHPYIRNTSTADTVIAYLAQREIYRTETVEVEVNQEARQVVPGERVTLTYAPLGFSAQAMEVRRVRKALDRITLSLGQWSAQAYAYTAATILPTDPVTPTPGDGDGTTTTPTTIPGSVGVTFDGGGAELEVGSKGDVYVPFDAVIQEAVVLADQTGDIVVDVWKSTYAAAPPTVAGTICAAAKPTLTDAVKSRDTTLTGWTTALAAGDILRFNVDSSNTLFRATVALKIKKTGS